MSEERIDPSGNTQQFQAFASAGVPESQKSKAPLVIVAVVLAVAIVALVAFVVVAR